MVSCSIFATIPCTKIIGFCFSFICFVAVFILALYQDDFCLKLKECDDIKVSLAIVLTFLVGLICYFISVACFCCSRDFSREVYRGQWRGDESVNMYLPNRTLLEFVTVGKSQKTQRLEANLIRQFRGLEPI